MEKIYRAAHPDALALLVLVFYGVGALVAPLAGYAQRRADPPEEPAAPAAESQPPLTTEEAVALPTASPLRATDERTAIATADPEAADPENALTGDAAEPGTERVTRSLSRFLDGSPDIPLRHASASADVSVPLPAAWAPQQLLLRLKYRNSVNLLEEHSQLRVELNGLIVAQFKLDPSRPEGEARIRLPVELLEPGYNQLRFAVAQHTIVGECEDPLAPELWTQIDAVESSLTLDYRSRPVVRSLADIEDMLGKYAWDQARLRIALALGNGEPTTDQLEWGALVAQGAAVRLEYRSLDVELRALSELDRPSADRALFEAAPHQAPDGIVIIGTAAQLAPALGPDWAEKVTDSYLGLLPGDADDPQSADRLVVSGPGPDEVKRAAVALGLIDLPLPDRQDVLIGQLSLPTLPPHSGQRALMGGAVATLADLGIQTTTLGSAFAPANGFSGNGTGGGSAAAPKTSVSLDFWVPAGVFPGRDQHGVLTLDFSYGAKLRGDSVLDLTLNGIFVRSIPLDVAVGATQLGYQVRFPFDLLVAGQNRLEITPQMVPSFTDLCQLRQGENLRFTLFDSSSLMLPDVDRLVSLPDLTAFSRAGFPLLKDPTGSDLGVQLATADAQTIAAAWTILGRLAQLIQMPLYRAQIGYEPFPAKFAQLVVGPVDAIDPDLLASAPVAIREGQLWVTYPVLELIAPRAGSGSWAERGLARLQRFVDPPPGVASSRDAVIGFEQEDKGSGRSASLFGRQGGLFEFQANAKPGRPVLLLTASTPELLQKRAARLVQPDFWYNLSGGFALWDDRDESLVTRPVQERFTVGHVSPANRANYLLNTYPQALLATALLLILLLVSLLFIVTRRFRRQSGAGAVNEE